MEPDDEDLYTKRASVTEQQPRRTIGLTFVGEEVDATDRLLDLQALLQLAGLDVPEADRLVVRPTDEALP